MTKIDFYYDPSCPFCWITSQWLLDVSKHRDIDISWRQFSLALKNNELSGKDDKTPHGDVHRASHRTQRVIRAAVRDHGVSSIELYSEFGMRFHIQERPFDDDMICEVLEGKNLPVDELLAAADDTSLDADLQTELDSALEAAGDDIGVPTIVFPGKDGERLGYFGPVLDALPESIEESLALWDGISGLATSNHFYEIKRSRKNSPNVFSAAKC